MIIGRSSWCEQKSKNIAVVGGNDDRAYVSFVMFWFIALQKCRKINKIEICIFTSHT